MVAPKGQQNAKATTKQKNIESCVETEVLLWIMFYVKTEFIL